MRDGLYASIYGICVMLKSVVLTSLNPYEFSSLYVYETVSW